VSRGPPVCRAPLGSLVASHVAYASLVLVVPDGPLGCWNLAALRRGTGGPLVIAAAAAPPTLAERDVRAGPGACRAPIGCSALGPDYDRGRGRPAVGRRHRTPPRGTIPAFKPGCRRSSRCLPAPASGGRGGSRPRGGEGGSSEAAALLVGTGAATEGGLQARGVPHAEIQLSLGGRHRFVFFLHECAACVRPGTTRGAAAVRCPLLRSGLLHQAPPGGRHPAPVRGTMVCRTCARRHPAGTVRARTLGWLLFTCGRLGRRASRIGAAWAAARLHDSPARPTDLDTSYGIVERRGSRPRSMRPSTACAAADRVPPSAATGCGPATHPPTGPPCATCAPLRPERGAGTAGPLGSVRPSA
jgi:hypothetical protein